MSQVHYFDYKYSFPLEAGATLPGFRLGYTTFGTLSRNAGLPDCSNVIWVCHALTGNPDPTDWWNGMVGPGKFYDPKQWFVVCANVIGS
ncbi:MAG: homoserine O-acetyltransferase, partial [Rudanella sp.]|nr:homoserine O-acetyltransferase [Rudanella sp.]